MKEGLGGALRILLALAACTVAHAQEAGTPPTGPGPSGERGGFVGGTITSVGVDRLEIKRQNGEPLVILVSDQTEFREGQQKIALEDLKPGDRVGARGQMNADKQFVATSVRRITEEEAQRFQQTAGDRAFGEIVSIEGHQLKIRNPRQGDRTITVNDQTSFLKDGQPITLKDLKPGDRIFAVGKEENGQFTATRVMSGQFRGRRQGGPEQN